MIGKAEFEAAELAAETATVATIKHYGKVFVALEGMDSGYTNDWIYHWVHSTEQGRRELEWDTIEHLYKGENHDHE